MRHTIHAALSGGLLLVGVLGAPGLCATVVNVGQGSYLSGLPAGAKAPPRVIYATPAVQGKMPTNDWWSSLAWMPFSEPQYSHPLAVRAERAGLRIYYPGSRIMANDVGIFGTVPGGGRSDVILGHSQQPEFADARVDGFSDWFVRAKFSQSERSMTVSYGHGSPFVFARFAGGNAQLTFEQPPQVWAGDARSPLLGVTINGNHYGLFGPRGSSWKGLGGAVLTCESDKDYFSLAVLPDNQPSTLQRFQKYAHCHVTDTKIASHYDPAASTVTTTYSVTVAPLEGAAQGTLLALYPHQWRHTDAQLLKPGYASVRGEMKLFEGSSFQTRLAFPGVLPCLPNVGACDEQVMADLLRAEADARIPPARDTYWEGKWLGKTATLIPIAEQYGQTDVAGRLRERLRTRLEQWFRAVDENGQPKRNTLFCYDALWGTLIGYPASFGSDTDLNDHHFHYGYFIRAAAEIARGEPDWARQWGGMVELLIRDVASPERHDPLFPFLRNFDPYAGHSWASGNARFADGNNQESSSEAMNAWYGIILWGELTGNRRLRDLGIHLYTTEMTAIHEYWFDVHHTNHPPGYTPAVVTMVWGGKGVNETWFSGKPEHIHGINWLPIHGGSLYLGHFPQYVEENYAALREENRGEPWSAWADLICMYRALVDPQDALGQFAAGKDRMPREDGNSLANTYHWIATLGKLGVVQPQVTANSRLYAVFDRAGTRNYVVYCPDQGSQSVSFSDGYRLECARPGFSMGSRALR